MRRRLTTLITLLLLTGFGARGTWSTPTDYPTRTSVAAAVTVKVTPRALSGPVWEFELSFDTHSRALNDDVGKTAALVTDRGQTFLPVKWLGDPPGSHHRKGVLQFKAISPLPATIELRISREGELQPRVFAWSLQGDR